MQKKPLRFLTATSSPLNYMQYIVFGSVILYFARNILIPVSFALLISFVLYPICAWLERRGFSRIVAVGTTIFFLMCSGLLVVALLAYQFAAFLQELPEVQSKFSQSMVDVSQAIQALGISEKEQSEILSRLSSQSGEGVVTIIKDLLSSSALNIAMLILVPIYAVLILYYRHYWMKILIRLFPSERIESLYTVVSLTIKAYYNFIKGMSLVYLAVGVLNSVGLLLLGVPHAILFGFIASILTFIPYVGIAIGALLPMAMAWITYDSVWYPIGVAAIFTFVQYLEANVIFPVAVSSRLNVNTLAMLMAIFLGGMLWGMPGMILFVPFAGIAKLIADHNPKWKTVSMILGMDKIESPG